MVAKVGNSNKIL